MSPKAPERPVEKMLRRIVETWGDGPGDPTLRRDPDIFVSWLRRVQEAVHPAARLVEAWDAPGEDVPHHEGDLGEFDEPLGAEAEEAFAAALPRILEGRSFPVNDPPRTMALVFDFVAQAFAAGVLAQRRIGKALPPANTETASDTVPHAGSGS